MNEQDTAQSPGARELASIERNESLLHILYAVDLSVAREELLNVENVLEGIVLLGRWGIHYPTSTGELLRRIAKDPTASKKLAPILLGCVVCNETDLNEDADTVLAAAFPMLQGPWRDAAADRPRVRRLAGIAEGVGYETVPKPEPDWRWQIGKPFPPANSVEGAQARLNYFGRGCGP